MFTALPESVLVHSLSFLRLPCALYSTACTCRAAKPLIQAHWGELKPQASVFRDAFVAQLTATHTAPSRYHEIYNAPETLPELMSPAHPVVLVQRVQAKQSFRVPNLVGGSHAAITSFKILQCCNVDLRLSVGGDTIVRIPAESVCLFVDADGALELLQFTKYLPLPAIHHVCLLCSVAQDVRITQSLCHLQDVHESFRIDQVESVLRAAPVCAPLSLYMSATAEHLLVRLRDDNNEACIEQFTLILVWQRSGRSLSLSIPGWACMRRTEAAGRYYEIPLRKQVNFHNEFCSPCSLVIQGAALSAGARVDVLALTQNVVVHHSGLMGLKFCTW